MCLRCLHAVSCLWCRGVPLTLDFAAAPSELGPGLAAVPGSRGDRHTVGAGGAPVVELAVLAYPGTGT